MYCGECDDDYNIGRQTFYLTIGLYGNVMLRHVNNQNLTEVEYVPQKAGKRREFFWIMFPDCEKIVVTSATQLNFEVILARPAAHTKLYQQLRNQFMIDAEKKSWQSIPSFDPIPRPQMQPFFYRRKGRELGRGSFGKVDVVVDASTDIEYA